MDSLLRTLLLTVVLVSASATAAESTFMVSPVLGVASETAGNVDDSRYMRIDGSFYPLPQLGINLFFIRYDDFEAKGGGVPVSISLGGGGAGVIGRWRPAEYVEPFVRAEYLLWNSEATSLNQTLGSDSGGSFGIATGAMFPITSLFGLKLELLRYAEISGSDFNHLSLGLMFEF